jgi:hypothetical protein
MTVPDFSSQEASVIIGGRTASLQLVSANGASVQVSVAVPPGVQSLDCSEREAAVSREAALVLEAAARHLRRTEGLVGGNASLSTTMEIEPAH